MARKSRKNQIQKQPTQQEKVWQAALYIRLSVEFNSNRGDSLETQRQIMEAYLALCPDIEIAEIYTDNGVSGRTFERAGFQKMLADIDAGKINCVVVKDLSRLGRNAIGAGFYLEKYFPLHHVRFISVNDQYDSETADSGAHMIVPLKNMVNEAHAADISRKVRSQQRQAMQEGKFVGGRPPYGYSKDPQDCHKLVVNPDTAPIVRQIFEWTVEGVSLLQIARNLNIDGVLSPSNYLASVGIITHKKLIGDEGWQTRALNKILADEVYLGDMVQGKTKAVGHKQVQVPPDEWVVVRGTHEPIISREVFEKVQLVRAERLENHKNTNVKHYSQNLLRGRIFCGSCGNHLQRHRYDSGYLYYCITNSTRGKGTCTGKTSLAEQRLFRVIISIICKKSELIMGNDFRLKRQNSKFVEKKREREKEISVFRREADQNRRFLQGLHESLVSGLLTHDEYLKMKAGYEQKFQDAFTHVQCLQEQQAKLERQAKEYTSLAEQLAKVDGDTELTAQLVDALIERVTVNSADDIVIDFRFENAFDELMEVLDE